MRVDSSIEKSIILPAGTGGKRDFMKLPIKIIILTMTGFGAAVPPAGAASDFFRLLGGAEVAQIRADAQQRSSEFFTSQAGKALNPRAIIVDWENRGDFTRYWNQDIMMFALRAFELNELLDDANAAIQEMCQYHLDRPQTFLEVHSFPSVTDALISAVRLFGPEGSRAAGRMSSGTYAKVLETMREWARVKSKITQTDIAQSQTWWITDSENHHAQHWSTCWGFSMILKEDPLYREQLFDDGHTPQEHYDAWTAYLREYLIQRMKKGMLVEIDSPSYASATLRCVYLLHSGSDDPELKRLAGEFMTLYWAMWAEQQIDGVHGGAKTRCYPESATSGVDFISRAAWYAFGIGDSEFRHISMLQFILSDWQPPESVLNLIAAPSGRGVYEVRQRRMGLAEPGYTGNPQIRLRTDSGGILRYSWCTPDFIMSSLMTEARPATDWANISSQNRWSGVIFRGHTNARIYPYLTQSGTGSIYNGYWVAQSKGTQISQKLLTSSGANEWRVWFSKPGLSAPVREGDWVFAEATNAFAAVRVVEGGFSISETNTGYWVACSNQYSPVIIEAAQKSDFIDAEAFRTAILALPVQSVSNVLTYTGLSGESFVFYADQSRPPEINGATVNYAPEKVYDSPYIQGGWAGTDFSIRYGASSEQVIFSESAAAVDWGGLYGNSFSGTINQALGTAVTPSGDYTFDGIADTAYRIPFGTVYSPSTDSRYLAPEGKTGPLYTGMMLVNHSSATAPTNAGLYRWSAGTNPNQLHKTNPTLTGDYTTMSMSVSYFAKKADFLSGLDPAGSAGFTNEEDGASVSLSALRNRNAGVATIGFIAQEGADWYVSVAWTRPTDAEDWFGTLSINPYQADWHAFDPLVNPFLNLSDPGSAKAGSTFTNITAFGITGQITGYDGTVANSQKLDFTGFDVRLKRAELRYDGPDPLDVDGDGLPDAWEIRSFGHLWTSDGSGDYDGNGFIDLHEYLAGTDPTVSDSLLKLRRIVPSAAGDVTVHWQSVTGKQYRILHTTNLVSGLWETKASGIPGAELNSSRTVTTEGTEGFFRIQTE